MLAKDLTNNTTFFRKDHNGDLEQLTARKDAELDKHSQRRSYRLLCEDVNEEKIYWLFDAWEEVTPITIEWGDMLPTGHAGWPHVACEHCGEPFISKDVDLCIDGYREHLTQHHMA